MSFYRLNGWFLTKCNSYSARVGAIQQMKGQVPEWQCNYLTESLVSEIWLSWCMFSRFLLHKSLRGTKARDLTVVRPRIADNSWQSIGHQSKKISAGSNHLVATPPGFLMRREPTWGDVTVFIKIVQAIMPSNSAQLLTAYGLPLLGPRHIQIVRNCTAHKTVENMLDLRAQFALHYSIPQKATPVDVAWAYRVGSSDIAIDLWVRHMKTIALEATRTS